MPRILAAILLLSLVPNSILLAQQSGSGAQLEFPGEEMSDERLAMAAKAERLLEEGDYERAFWYYRKELAPIGFKQAQFMVGFLTSRGLGTRQDPVLGAAWYILAAERGHPAMVNNLDGLMSGLTEAQKREAHLQAEELRKEYGDRSLIERLIRQDIARLSETTGSRINRDECGTRNLRVYSMDSLGSMDGSRYCQMLNDRIDARVAYLTGYVEYGALELLPDEDEDEDSAAESVDSEDSEGE